MKNTINALLSIGFSQEEAQNQLKELNDLILALVAQQVAEENPGVELTAENFKEVVENKYSKEQYQELFQKIAAEAVKGYFEAVTKDLIPLKRDAFFKEVEQDFQKEN